MKNHHRYILLLVLLFAIPAIADACPMCQGPGSEETVSAYKKVTLFLAALPIFGAFGIFYWLYSRSKKMDTTVKNDSL